MVVAAAGKDRAYLAAFVGLPEQVGAHQHAGRRCSGRWRGLTSRRRGWTGPSCRGRSRRTLPRQCPAFTGASRSPVSPPPTFKHFPAAAHRSVAPARSPPNSSTVLYLGRPGPASRRRASDLAVSPRSILFPLVVVVVVVVVIIVVVLCSSAGPTGGRRLVVVVVVHAYRCRRRTCWWLASGQARRTPQPPSAATATALHDVGGGGGGAVAEVGSMSP